MRNVILIIEINMKDQRWYNGKLTA